MGHNTQSPQQLTETNKSIYGEESFNMKNFTVGAIVGALARASIALLYAPKPGADLRQNVASQAETLKDKSMELSSIAKEKTAHLSSQLKEQSTHLVDKVKAITSKEDNSTLEETSIEEVVIAVDDTVTELTAGISQKADATIEELLEDTKA